MSLRAVARSASSFVLALLLPATYGCGPVGPSCIDETQSIFHVTAEALSAAVASYTVTSPKGSNLLMRLTWADTQATLGMSATITNCGGHAGCTMDTLTPPFGPGGPSPVPQPWPQGLREMTVDGWQGKTYRIDITGDAARAVNFTLDVIYQIRCER